MRRLLKSMPGRSGTFSFLHPVTIHRDRVKDTVDSAQRTNLLYKIPFFRKRKNLPGHKALIWLKYIILAVFVFLPPPGDDTSRPG